jgi:hypothetical protein
MNAKKLAKLLLNWKYGKAGKPASETTGSGLFGFDIPISSIPRPEPQVVLWKVNINSTQGYYQKHVLAKTAKEAILAAIETAPNNHEVFNFPGWQLSCSIESRAFVVEGKTP